jgi:hypothetical protein
LKKRKIVVVDGVTDEGDYRGYQEMHVFGANVFLPILEDGDEPAYVRRDHDEAFIVNNPRSKDSYIIVNFVIGI